MLDQVERDRLDQWRWQSFVGEEAALECLYAEAPDTTAKRCLSKVRVGSGGWSAVRGQANSEGSRVQRPRATT